MFEILVNFIDVVCTICLVFCPSTLAPPLLSLSPHKFLTLALTAQYSVCPSTYPLFPLHSWFAFFSKPGRWGQGMLRRGNICRKKTVCVPKRLVKFN